MWNFIMQNLLSFWGLLGLFYLICLVIYLLIWTKLAYDRHTKAPVIKSKKEVEAYGSEGSILEAIGRGNPFKILLWHFLIIWPYLYACVHPQFALDFKAELSYLIAEYLLVFLGEFLVSFGLFMFGFLWYRSRFLKIEYSEDMLQLLISSYIFLGFFLMLYIYDSFSANMSWSNGIIEINCHNWFIKLLLFFITFFVLLFSVGKEGSKNQLEFICLMLLSLLGTFFVVSSSDFFFLYLSMELMSLPIYVLLGSKKSIISIESSIKYFILGSIVSVFMLFGISLIYGFFGTTNYSDLRDLLLSQGGIWTSEAYFTLFSFSFLFIMFFFKLGLAPFHLWVTDLYEGASISVIFFLTLAPKLAVLFAFYRLFVVIFSSSVLVSFYINGIFFFIGLLSVFVGTWGGLKETNVMRMIGQSSIVLTGFFFLLLNAAQFDNEPAIFFAYMLYCVIMVQFFAFLIVLGGNMKDIMFFANIARASFVWTVFFAILIFSMSGIPPYVGYLIKFYIFKALVDTNLTSTALFVFLHSIITSLFYLRLFYLIITKPTGITIFIELPYSFALLLTSFFLLDFTLIVFHDPFYMYIVKFIKLWL